MGKTPDLRIGVLNLGSATAKAALVAVGGSGPPNVLRRSQAALDGSGSRDALRGACRDVLTEIAGHGAIPDAVGHRVVHGGQAMVETVQLDRSAEEALRQLAPLAPLHNPPALEGLAVAREMFPRSPMWAVFDTAFHAERTEDSRRYALPWDLSDQLGLFRYGFHGVAHAALVDALAEAEGVAAHEVHAVTLQLGAGCSACAVSGGRSLETSMGFSPLEGLPMATRCGDVDPRAVLELVRRLGDVEAVERLLHRESGWFGLAGVADFRELLAAESRDERARVAVAMFERRVAYTVGAYLTALGGRGALVFGGGIGTGSPEIRQRIGGRLRAWNVELDPAKNGSSARGRISTAGSRPVYIFETDEETWIARSVAMALAKGTP